MPIHKIRLFATSTYPSGCIVYLPVPFSLTLLLLRAFPSNSTLLMKPLQSIHTFYVMALLINGEHLPSLPLARCLALKMKTFRNIRSFHPSSLLSWGTPPMRNVYTPPSIHPEPIGTGEEWAVVWKDDALGRKRGLGQCGYNVLPLDVWTLLAMVSLNPYWLYFH